MPVSSKLNNLEHLKDISFKDLSDKTIGLLIGVGVSVVYRALESRFRPEGTPDAIRTSLGWVLFGPALRCQCYAEVRNNSATDTCMHVILPENAKVDPSLPPHEYEVTFSYPCFGDIRMSSFPTTEQWRKKGWSH